MNKIILMLIGLASIASMTFSCTEKIEIDLADSESRLVIYGALSNQQGPHEVRVTRTSGYYSADIAKGVEGAYVTLSDGSGNVVLTPVAGDPGLYLTPVDMWGVPGVEYTLRVEVDSDNDGVREVYEAVSAMPFAATVDDVGLRKRSFFGDYIEVLYTGTLPLDEGYYLNFKVWRNDDPVNDSLKKFSLVEQRYFGTETVAEMPCVYLAQDEESEKLSADDVVTLYVDILSPGYGKFLKSAQTEVNGLLPVFTGPPANIATNIAIIQGTARSKPLGYFGTYARSASSVTYR